MSDAPFKIGLFYGSTTCYTEMTAEKIQAELGPDLVDVHNIKDVSLQKTADYDLLIFGISTWDFGEIQEDWESCWDDIKSLNMDGKIAALYGMGDQYGYADWYQDALGMLHDELAAVGCAFVGYWPNQGYEFSASKALTPDQSHFVGLALDDENQFDQSEARIAAWTVQILEEIAAALED